MGSEKKRIRREVTEFLKDPSRKVISVKYKGPHLNSAKDWHYVRNPIRLIWNSFITEITQWMPPCEFKNMLLRMIGMKIGKDVVIVPKAYLDWLFPDLIEIEDGAIIGGFACIGTHEYLIDEIRIGRVKIGKQVMVGSWVYVPPGVDIGERAVLGVFAYANKGAPPYGFMVGSPAVVKRDLKQHKYLEDFDKELKKYK